MTQEILSWAELRIDNGSFTLDAGSHAFTKPQIVALVGGNGSGKTTLLRCLAGLLSPSQGRIFYAGNDAHNLSLAQRARFASWCPSEHHVPFAYTCYDLVLLGRYAFHQGLPTDRDRELVDRALARVDLGGFSLRTVDQLSSGELQRVMVARCLAAQTSVMLLDEPSANLDAAHALALFETLEDLKKDRVTTVVSVHDINLASRFADTVLLLGKGKIVAAGRSETVLTTDSLRKVLNIQTEKLTLSNGLNFFAPLSPADRAKRGEESN